MHFPAVTKTHLNLGRVHVHIHPQGIDVHIQHIHRLALTVQHIFISGARGMRDYLVAHETAIDVGILLVGSAARKVRQAAAAMHTDPAASRLQATIHRQALRHKSVSQHIGHAPVGVCSYAPLLQQLAVVPHSKADIRTRQGLAAHGIQAMRQFGSVTLEEFAARRRTEKQFSDLDCRTPGARARAQFAAARMQEMAVCRTGGGRQHGKLGDGRNGCQRLTPKPHGGHRFQVVQTADLAGGVALNRERQLLRRNARAIVLHRDQAHTAGLQPHRDLGCARIQCVVQQLAHDGSRTLNDFARSDLTDQLVR